MLRAHKHAMNETPAIRRLRAVMGAVGLFMLVAGAVSFYTGHTDLPGFIGMAVLSIFFLGWPLLLRRGVLKKYAQMPDRDRVVNWEIAEDRVISRTDLATAEMTWGAFIRVVRFSDGFLLSPNVGLFHWLPTHAFQNPEDADQFAELAKSKVQVYHQRD